MGFQSFTRQMFSSNLYMNKCRWSTKKKKWKRHINLTFKTKYYNEQKCTLLVNSWSISDNGPTVNVPPFCNRFNMWASIFCSLIGNRYHEKFHKAFCISIFCKVQIHIPFQFSNFNKNNSQFNFNLHLSSLSFPCYTKLQVDNK